MLLCYVMTDDAFPKRYFFILVLKAYAPSFLEINTDYLYEELRKYWFHWW